MLWRYDTPAGGKGNKDTNPTELFFVTFSRPKAIVAIQISVGSRV